MPDLPAEHLPAIDRVVETLGGAESLLFITGAGISADSGLPTYRGIGGLYERDETEDGLPIEELLSGEMIRRRPELTWKYLAQIARSAQGAGFNRGHAVIAEMERHFARVWTLTQNIDGFHRQAGAAQVIEIHGDLHDLLCPACDWSARIERMDQISVPPKCPQCGAIVRPDVVLFGEMLPPPKIQRLYEELHAGFDVVFSVGTSSVFPYIIQPVLLAREMGWKSVEINPGETRISELVDVRVPLRAAEALDAIWRRYQERCASGR